MSGRETALARGEAVWRPRLRARKAAGAVFVGLCVLSVLLGVAMLAALVIDVSLDGAARLFSAPEFSLSARYSGVVLAALVVLALLFRFLDRRGIRIDGALHPAGLGAPTTVRLSWALPVAAAWWIGTTVALRIPRALGRLPWIVLAMLLLTWAVYLFLDQAFLTSFASRIPSRAGIYAPLIGTLYMMVITAAVAFPLGVGAAIYLEEYARQNWFAKMIQINIANLAGVPSIVYGLLGLQLFVRAMELDRSVLAGALTMSLLVMPIIIVSAQEALRAVPPSMREGAYALGATRWQVIWRSVLPFAFGGTLTGAILALSRAIGETAPILVIGGLTFIAFLPESPTDSFTILPIQIFNWVSRPQEEFQFIAAAGIILLLLVLLLMNSVAIILRQRTRVRW
jgi:phosphate transport system permease protein